MIHSSRYKQIKIVIPHLRSVSKEYQLQDQGDDYLLNDKLIHVIDQQLKMLYLSLHVQFCYNKGSLSFISLFHKRGQTMSSII